MGWLTGRKNHDSCIFCYAIFIFPLYQEQTRTYQKCRLKKECIFRAVCPQCKVSLALGAQVDYPPTMQELTSNASSKLMLKKEISNISFEEMKDIKDGLSHFGGSFKSLFNIES